MDRIPKYIRTPAWWSCRYQMDDWQTSNKRYSSNFQFDLRIIHVILNRKFTTRYGNFCEQSISSIGSIFNRIQYQVSLISQCIFEYHEKLVKKLSELMSVRPESANYLYSLSHRKFETVDSIQIFNTVL